MDAFSWGESYNTISFLLNGQIKMKGLKQACFAYRSLSTRFSQLDFFPISLLSDSWSVPFALSCICLFLQIIHILLYWVDTVRKPDSVVDTESSLADTMASTFSHSVKKKVRSHGGWTIYLFMVARLFGCLVLFTLSVNSFLGCQRNHPGVVDTVSKHLSVGCPEVLMTVPFVNLLSCFLL